MEFIKIARRRSLLSSSAHVLLNVLLVAAILSSIFVTDSPYIAIILVLASKWRVFAVRPRFWLANVKSNLVDLIVCLGLVLLMWFAESHFWIAQSVVAAVYTIWLLFIKPRSGEFFTILQAVFSVFVGFYALFSVSYSWPLVAIVFCAWLVGYSSARHIMASSENKNVELLSLTWGLILAETAWLFSHWVVGYSLFGTQTLIVPQAAIISTTLSFLVFSIYKAYDKDKKITLQEIILPTIFSLIVCFVLMTFFSSAV